MMFRVAVANPTFAELRRLRKANRCTVTSGRLNFLLTWTMSRYRRDVKRS